MTEERTKFDGVQVYMAGRDWVIPPLSLKYIRTNKDRLAKMRALGQKGKMDFADSELDEFLDEAREIILAAMQRNYSNVSKEDLEEWIDLATLPKLVMAVMSASGFAMRAGSIPGEAPAAP